MKKNDWHVGFVSAMKLELIADEDNLDYIEEHNLANRAQRIDLLIIKQIKERIISKSIGKAFRKFNIIEYKGPGDYLNYEEFHLVMAYAHLYFNEQNESKTYGNGDYSVTIIQETHPRDMFKLMQRDKLQIRNTSEGIYEIGNEEFFKIQVIVTEELPESDYIWLRSLTRNGTIESVGRIINETAGLDKVYREHADNVMNVFISSNMELMNKVKKEDKDMCKAVEELFAEEHKKEIDDLKKQKQESDKKIAELEAELAKYKKQEKVLC